jgi:hypothetical protein
MTTKVNIANLRAKLAQLAGQNRSLDDKYLLIPDYDASNLSRSTIRILPGPADNPDAFFSETILHRINGKNVQSPRIMGKPCPIQEYIRYLWNTGEEENIKIAREIKGTKRFYFNVISRERIVANKETGKEEAHKNDGPLIFSCGIKLFQKVLSYIVDPDYENMLDLKDGFDFKVRKEQVGGYPNYDQSCPSRKSSSAGSDEEIEKWMLNLHDLKELIKIPSYNELVQELNMFRGIQGNNAGNSNSSDGKEPLVPVLAGKSESFEEEENDEEFLKTLESIKKITKK